MVESIGVSALGQEDFGSAREVMLKYFKGAMRQMLVNVMAEELETLCGTKYHPDNKAEFYRAGSANGYAYFWEKREAVTRPRVRKKMPDGKSVEVALESYTAAQGRGELEQELISAIISNGSARKFSTSKKQRGTSHASISKIFAKHGREIFSELRGRNISSEDFDWFAITIDGVVLAKDMTAVVALGIMSDGRKSVLDFELGASENIEVVSALMSRITKRGFKPSGKKKLFAILDGSAALKTALLKYFPDAVVQRCLVHKERNLRRYISKRLWPTLSELMDRLRKAEGARAGVESLRELDEFLLKTNSAARESLHEAGTDLISLHLLEAPATLNKHLLSTNMIENVILNLRSANKNVRRWRAESDQAARWLAVGLIEAEKGFHRIGHFRELPRLVESLGNGTYEKSLRLFESRSTSYAPFGLRPHSAYEVDKSICQR